MPQLRPEHALLSQAGLPEGITYFSLDVEGETRRIHERAMPPLILQNH